MADAPKQIVDRLSSKWARVDVDQGWYTLLVVLDRDLSEIIPNYVLVQVKEKFGTLRYYVDLSHSGAPLEDIATFRGRVTEAEIDSATTCETCGAYVNPEDAAPPNRRSHYIRTLCKRHSQGSSFPYASHIS